MAGRALSFSKAPRVSATHAKTPSADLRHSESRSGKLQHDRRARSPFDDVALDCDERRTAGPGGDVMGRIARCRTCHKRREVFTMYPVYVGETDEQARREAIEHWHRWRAFAM